MMIAYIYVGRDLFVSLSPQVFLSLRNNEYKLYLDNTLIITDFLNNSQQTKKPVSKDTG